MSSNSTLSHWLDQYGSEYYHWRLYDKQNSKTFYRPVGLVESSFDSDGRYYEGRADISAQLELEIATSISQQEIKKKIALAWTCLRCYHLMLQTRSIHLSEISPDLAQPGNQAYHFAINIAENGKAALRQASDFLTFLDKHYTSIDPGDFWVHCQNVGRVVDPSTGLARVFVLPTVPLENGNATLRFVFVMGHQIADGMSNTRWMRHFTDLMNHKDEDLLGMINDALDVEKMHGMLPPAQEAVYPPISGNIARKRWFWLLSRILRHVRKPLAEGFENPLKRRGPPRSPIALSPVYDKVLDYTRVPILNAFPCNPIVSAKDTAKLHRLCRQANVSIGSGCFALTALTMMEMYERQQPDVALEDRKPFITGFPLDPRAFLAQRIEADSLMLAFSDGILLPFLPASLPLDGRLRLTAKQAHRQLKAYQKRKNSQSKIDDAWYMGSRGVGRMLQLQYLNSLDRSEANKPAHLRSGINPQGSYPMRPNMNRATCGVSSVGRREALIKSGLYDLQDCSKDFVADFRNMNACVRPRQGEFLIGVAGTEQGVHASVNIDGCAIDPILADEWRELFENILSDRELTAKL